MGRGGGDLLLNRRRNPCTILLFKVFLPLLPFTGASAVQPCRGCSMHADRSLLARSARPPGVGILAERGIGPLLTHRPVWGDSRTPRSTENFSIGAACTS